MSREVYTLFRLFLVLPSPVIVVICLNLSCRHFLSMKGRFTCSNISANFATFALLCSRSLSQVLFFHAVEN